MEKGVPSGITPRALVIPEGGRIGEYTVRQIAPGMVTLNGPAGPVGRQAGASTDAKFTSQILSYSRSKGLFAGLELKGVVKWIVL